MTFLFFIRSFVQPFLHYKVDFTDEYWVDEAILAAAPKWNERFWVLLCFNEKMRDQFLKGVDITQGNIYILTRLSTRKQMFNVK